MTTLDQIIAETAEYTRLKAESTDGDWRRVDYDDDYDASLCHYVMMHEDEKWANTVDSTMLKKCDADFIIAAHNTPLEQYITLLVNRVRRLEGTLRDISDNLEHDERCHEWNGCRCGMENDRKKIENALFEGLE